MANWFKEKWSISMLIKINLECVLIFWYLPAFENGKRWVQNGLIDI